MCLHPIVETDLQALVWWKINSNFVLTFLVESNPPSQRARVKQTNLAFPNVHGLSFSLLSFVNEDVKGDAKGISNTTYLMKDTEQSQYLNTQSGNVAKKLLK